jgi:hypothetical protein
MWTDVTLAPAREGKPLPLRFVLVGEGPHALSPSLGVGPTLCGEEEPPPGWALDAGFTSADHLDRIGCDDCRMVARRLVDAAREAGAALEGRR